MKKILAVLLTITAPIWGIPVALVVILWYMFSELYKDMLELIDYISKHFGVKK